jgi:hypothetical protein
MAEGGTVGALTETSDKISSIDMNKNIGEAGNLLGGFYAGSKNEKGAESAVVYAEQGNAQAPKQAEKDVCNAKPSKIGKLEAKVQPLSPLTADKTLLNQNKSTWLEDLDTVVDYVEHVGGHAVETVDALNGHGNSIDPDEAGLVHGVINTIDAAVNP